MAGSLGGAVLVIVVALALGDRLNAWRADRSASGPSASAGRVALDPRYGLLAQISGSTDPGGGNGAESGMALVDETGKQLVSTFDGLVDAKTSPNGRYIAALLSTQRGLELHVLDAVAGSLGPALFTTTEQRPRVNEPMVWASDSSEVLLATTADVTANSAGGITVNLRAIDRSGAGLRSILTYQTFTFQPLGWDRANGVILARAVTAQSGGRTLFLRIPVDHQVPLTEIPVDDSPVVANDAATYIASMPSCTPGPCRRFVIHDATTYAVVSTIDLGSNAPLTTTSGNWAVLFRPRSSDVLVYFNRSVKGVFGLELYPDAGRGARRDLGDMTVAPWSDGRIVSPNAYFRADGSAVFYLHPTEGAARAWTGDLIDLASGRHTPVMTGFIRATAVVDAKLEMAPQRPATPVTSASPAPRTAVADHIELPAEFLPLASFVSPDGNYVAAFAKDRGSVRLYRLLRALSSATPQLVQVAEVRGFFMAVSWLEDSSAVLVQTDLVPGHDLQSREQDPTYRVAIVNVVDGRIVIAPPSVRGVPSPTANLSADGHWVPVLGEPAVRVLSRDGLMVKTLVPAPSDGTRLDWSGWDRDGHVLYARQAQSGSVLVAVDLDGTERYRVPAPAGFGSVFWTFPAVSADRSWRVVAFVAGIGADFREYRLLVGTELRTLPDELTRSVQGGGVWARGDEIVYRSPSGAMRAYDVRAGTTRTLPLVVAPTASSVGLIDRFYVWTELLHGYVGDLDTGRIVDLPIGRYGFTRLDGAHIAENRPDSIAILDLATWFPP